MMGGDSSIYSRNGVGGWQDACQKGRNDKGSLSSPRSRCVLLLFFLLGFLFLLSALSTNLEACGRPLNQGLRANGLLWPLMSR
jgi:hypothetical protein